jgi:osmotically-inducible protein OsmY
MSSNDVKTAFQRAFQKDQGLMNSGVKVSVSDDKVALSGTASSADKDMANQIAEANAGGRQVVDHIKVSDSNSAAPKQ